MKSSDIHELNHEMQNIMSQSESLVENEAGFRSAQLSLIAEIAAQLAELNENKPTLRDQIAMVALQGIFIAGRYDPASTIDIVAQAAYKYADAMLEARR